MAGRIFLTRRTRYMNDNSHVIELICQALTAKDMQQASSIARESYPFVPTTPPEKRAGKLVQSMRVFASDGFIDRYSGNRLIFPGVLRLLSKVLPTEFRFHSNWAMDRTHIAFWELFPTIDHVFPIARGGADTEENMVSTSMLRNSAKANWTLKELHWEPFPAGNMRDWDGLTEWFLGHMQANPAYLKDSYLKKWHNAAVKVLHPKKGGESPERSLRKPSVAGATSKMPYNIGETYSVGRASQKNLIAALGKPVGGKLPSSPNYLIAAPSVAVNSRCETRTATSLKRARRLRGCSSRTRRATWFMCSSRASEIPRERKFSCTHAWPF